MKERNRKIVNSVTFILIVMLLSVCLVSCGKEYAVTVPSQTIELEKGESIALDYGVTIDGEADTSQEVDISVSGDSVSYSSESGQITAVNAGESVITISLKKDADISATVTVKVPLWEVSFSKARIDIEETAVENLTYEVLKDKAKQTGITKNDVTVEVDGDAVSYNSASGKISAIEKGDATVTVSLKKDPAVKASVTYSVKEIFFARAENLKRGTINFSRERDGEVDILGGQAAVLVKKADTNFVFKASLKVTDFASGEAFGVGSFINNGDNALWLGLKNTDMAADGKFSVYARDFYKGWGGATLDEIITGYEDREFGGDKIAFEIVRKGNDYYYSIGTCYGNYTTEYAEATYPGIFAQEKTVKVTDFSVEYGEDAATAAINRINAKGIASVVLGYDGSSIIDKGGVATFTNTIYPTGQTGTVVYSLDKSEMTGGQDGTSIDAEGVLTVAEDGAGFVTVIVTCGDVRDTMRLEIAAEKIEIDNDVIKTKGGVIWNAEEESITFPEFRNGNNGILNEHEQEESNYMAKLKRSIIEDFSIEFTVSDYKTTAHTPKLMISLGGKHNQIYLAYNYTGTNKSRFEMFVPRVAANGGYGKDGEWMNSVEFADFDPSIAHTYKIEVINGRYYFFLDGASIAYSGTSEGTFAVQHYEDWRVSRNVIFATNKGTSCKITDITFTDINNTQDFYLYNGMTKLIDDGFEMKFTDSGWGSRDWYNNRMASTTNLPSGDYTIGFNLEFSDGMTDSKFAVHIGKWDFYINNKVAASAGISGTIHATDNEWGSTNVASDLSSLKVEIKKLSGKMYFYINDIFIDSRETAPTGNILEFFAFNEKAEESEFTATLTGLTVQSGAIIMHKDNKTQLLQGQTATYAAVGATGSVIKFTLDKTSLTAGAEGTTITESGALTLDAAAAGKFIVIATSGNLTAKTLVTISDQPEIQDTTFAYTNGGVRQDVGTKSLTFLESNNSKNGVADEVLQKDSNYMAKLKQTVAGNFSIEFTVSDYKTTAEFPKLMISLGGRHQQFYVVYKNNGQSRIETFTDSKKTATDDDYNYGGMWLSTPFFTEFDAKLEHTFIIECTDGIYTVKVDGVAQKFYLDGNSSNDERTLLGIPTEHNVLISTNAGTSCSVSNINLTSDTPASTFVGNKDSASSQLSVDGFTAKLGKAGWSGGDSNRLISYGQLFESGKTMTFKLAFSKSTSSSKVCIRIGNGNNDYTICLDGTSMKAEIRNVWGGETISGADYTNISVKIAYANGKAHMWVNNKDIGETSVEGDPSINFWMFNENDADVNTTVTVSDLAFAAIA